MTDIHTLTLADVVWRPGGKYRALREATLVLAGAALMALSAKVNVPMYPVPMTMQTFAALVIGMTLGWRRAGAALSVYLLEGAVGLPVFATGGGLAYLLGPTGGYLLGFLVTAVSVGWLAERGWGRTFLKAFLANAMGTATIFSLGVGWLTVVLTTSSSMNASGAFDRALASGLYPFMFGAVVKTVLASVGLPAAWTILGRKH